MAKTPTADQYRRQFDSGLLKPDGKSPLDSKGILGGLVSATGFGLLAMFASRFLGFDLTSDEIAAVVGDGQVLALSAPVWIGLVGALIGLVGNWARVARVSFTGNGGRPWKSRGIMGNLVAAVSAVVVFVQAAALDADELKALLGDATKQWEITAPAAIALIGALKGLWGRYRATQPVPTLRARPVSGIDPDDDEPGTQGMGQYGLVLVACLGMLGLTSCEALRPENGWVLRFCFELPVGDLVGKGDPAGTAEGAEIVEVK